MDKMSKRLWRAEWVNLVGTHAPTCYVEAKTKEEALKLAKVSSRLADFPDKWSFKLTQVKTKQELRESGLIL